jgi:DNA invertase Pin-like site-specific DNA recombinase
MDTRKEHSPSAVGYLRLSSDEQGGSIERQRQALMASAAECYDIRSFTVETGGSGEVGLRPPKG